MNENARAVSEHRQRKNEYARAICKAHNLPPMSWGQLGTWAMKNGIDISLTFEDGVRWVVNGSNYAYKQEQAQ